MISLFLSSDATPDIPRLSLSFVVVYVDLSLSVCLSVCVCVCVSLSLSVFLSLSLSLSLSLALFSLSSLSLSNTRTHRKREKDEADSMLTPHHSLIHPHHHQQQQHHKVRAALLRGLLRAALRVRQRTKADLPRRLAHAAGAAPALRTVRVSRAVLPVRAHGVLGLDRARVGRKMVAAKMASGRRDGSLVVRRLGRVVRVRHMVLRAQAEGARGDGGGGGGEVGA
jgi:hypothetical protein